MSALALRELHLAPYGVGAGGAGAGGGGAGGGAGAGGLFPAESSP